MFTKSASGQIVIVHNKISCVFQNNWNNKEAETGAEHWAQNCVFNK